MTERVEPMGEMDIEYLVAVVRDHARLVADLEAHRSLSRNQIEQWQHERDALRAEVERLKREVERLKALHDKHCGLAACDYRDTTKDMP